MMWPNAGMGYACAASPWVCVCRVVLRLAGRLGLRVAFGVRVTHERDLARWVRGCRTNATSLDGFAAGICARCTDLGVGESIRWLRDRIGRHAGRIWRPAGRICVERMNATGIRAPLVGSCVSRKRGARLERIRAPGASTKLGSESGLRETQSADIVSDDGGLVHACSANRHRVGTGLSPLARHRLLDAHARHACSARLLGTFARHVCSARLLGTASAPRRHGPCLARVWTSRRQAPLFKMPTWQAGNARSTVARSRANRHFGTSRPASVRRD